MPWYEPQHPAWARGSVRRNTQTPCAFAILEEMNRDNHPHTAVQARRCWRPCGGASDWRATTRVWSARYVAWRLLGDLQGAARDRGVQLFGKSVADDLVAIPEVLRVLGSFSSNRPYASVRTEVTLGQHGRHGNILAPLSTATEATEPLGRDAAGLPRGLDGLERLVPSARPIGAARGPGGDRRLPYLPLRLTAAARAGSRGLPTTSILPDGGLKAGWACATTSGVCRSLLPEALEQR
jgi:hypothetical protein